MSIAEDREEVAGIIWHALAATSEDDSRQGSVAGVLVSCGRDSWLHSDSSSVTLSKLLGAPNRRRKHLTPSGCLGLESQQVLLWPKTKPHRGRYPAWSLSGRIIVANDGQV